MNESVFAIHKQYDVYQPYGAVGRASGSMSAYPHNNGRRCGRSARSVWCVRRNTRKASVTGRRLGLVRSKLPDDPSLSLRQLSRQSSPQPGAFQCRRQHVTGQWTASVLHVVERASLAWPDKRDRPGEGGVRPGESQVRSWSSRCTVEYRRHPQLRGRVGSRVGTVGKQRERSAWSRDCLSPNPGLRWHPPELNFTVDIIAMYCYPYGERQR